MAVNSSDRAKKIFENIERDSNITAKPEIFILANGVEPHLDASFFYLTGFPYGLFEGSYAVAKRDGNVSVLTTPLEADIANSHSDGMEVIADERAGLHNKLSRIVANPSVIGVNSSELEYESFLKIKSAFRNSTVVDVSNAIAGTRVIKDEGEIEAIKKACNISSKIYRRIPQKLKDGISENQLAAEMAYEMQSSGASGNAFDAIVAFGKNSAEPHYSPGKVKLRKGQFVLLDYGSKYRRYCSDITRTLVHGKATREQKKMYQTVKEALEIGTENCLISNSGADVDANVASHINSTEFKGRFIHSTGHSLGLSVHDVGPGLSKRDTKNLEPGMVLTVEPGIYVPGVGGVRIEDDVLITKGKPKVLTSASRELIEA